MHRISILLKAQTGDPRGVGARGRAKNNNTVFGDNIKRPLKGWSLHALNENVTKFPKPLGGYWLLLPHVPHQTGVFG